MTEPRKRSNLKFIAAVLGILLLLPLAYWLLLGQDPPAPPPPKPTVIAVPDAGPKKTELKLGEVNGKVTLRRGDGGWVEAKPGDPLTESDGVRTEDGSYAVLVGGEFWEVKMEPGTEVQVGQLSESISKILLESGMARAKVKAGNKHTFEVRASKSDAVASTTAGAFTVSNDGAGTVAVGTQEGEVQFAGKGKVVIVRAGEQSVAKANEEPSAPKAVPNSLLLKVALPVRQLTNRPKLSVSGITEPGAWVEIAGHTVIADKTGHFKAPLLLTEGNNAIEVKARGVGGVEADSKHAIEVDTQVKRPRVPPPNWK